jgi:hypothetical protein
MSGCMNCGSPHVKFSLICPACKQVEALEKQNELIADANRPDRPIETWKTTDSIILAGFVIGIIVFWDSGLITLIRGLVVAWFELIWMLFTL